jgi:hypothetical protein
MTREQAYALHDPFRSGSRSEHSVLCRSQQPDPSLLLGRQSVRLVFPNQEWIDLTADSPQITSLFVDRPRARDLSPLSSLSLINFSVSYPSYVKDWSFLSSFSSLLRLVLDNTLSIRDLEPLREFLNLEVLMISGGYSKTLKLPSLSPLSDLMRLKVVALAAVRFGCWDLGCLLRLPELCLFDCPLYWPKAEVMKLAQHKPHLISCALESKT